MNNKVMIYNQIQTIWVGTNKKTRIIKIKEKYKT